MNIKEVKELAEILNSNNLTRLEAAWGDARIILEKGPGSMPQPQKPQDFVPENRQHEMVEENTINFNHLIEIKSPMVGVFYSASSPDCPPFVSIGDKVKKGDVLCVIEAMKLMNEIEAEADGEIVDICVKDGDIAEYGQVLFKMI